MNRRLVWPLLLFALAAPATAQSLADYDYDNLRFRGVGFDFGRIWPSKVDATQAYSLRLDLGYLGPAVRIVPSISYWSSDFRFEELSRLADRLQQLPAIREAGIDITAADLGVVRWSDLSLALDTHVVWTVPYNLYTYLGAGIALHALNGRGDAIADTFVEDLLDSTTAGAAFMAGVELQPVQWVRFYGEARYTIASDVRYPGVRLGMAIMLPEGSNALANPQGGR
jgi:hypothetical protein